MVDASDRQAERLLIQAALNRARTQVATSTGKAEARIVIPVGANVMMTHEACFVEAVVELSLADLKAAQPYSLADL